MLFKNKTTNQVWDIRDDDHIKRCKKDKNYETVTLPSKTSKATQNKKATTSKETTATNKTKTATK